MTEYSKEQEDARWALFMGKSDKRVLTEEESRAICPSCYRLKSLMRNIEDAWNTQHDSVDGYRRLKYAIEAMKSEVMSG